MKAIAFSTKNKTYAVVEPALAQAMLFCGNPHGFNRATTFPDSGEQGMRRVMEANGYSEERSQA